MNEAVPKKPPRLLTGAFGVAVDQGSGLGDAIRAARGPAAADGDLFTFKQAVVAVMSREASVVLVDASFGPQLLGGFAAGCEPQMAFEADVYRISSTDRMTLLPDQLSVGDLPAMGVRRLKFFTYFSPRGEAGINRRKADLVTWLGGQCKVFGLEFLFEPLVYDDGCPDQSSHAFALLKPGLVAEAARYFSDPRFGIDVLKLEVPVNLEFVAGIGGGRPPAHSYSEALACFRRIGEATGLPVVYLSAGVSFDTFRRSLMMAREAGASFAGFMCGRAIWSDAIGVFGHAGEPGLVRWLDSTGLSRLRALKAAASADATGMRGESGAR